MDNSNSIIITPDGKHGWDITAYDSDGEPLKHAWSDNGQSAISKAFVIQDFYRNHAVILTHSFDADGNLREDRQVLRTGYLPQP